MAEVNPYVNTEGRTLTIYTRNGNNWSQTGLPSGMGATLSQDGIGRNIWDSGDKTVQTSNKLSGTAGWILPSSSDAGDINSVNVIIINNSNINHATTNNALIIAGLSVSARLPLGITHLNRLVTGSNTVLSTVLSTTSPADQTNPFQILPLPDQVVTISPSGTITAIVSSAVGTNIRMTTLSIHNCFNTMLYIRIRRCDGAVSQNIGQIAGNQIIRLSVYSTYEIFLESGNGMTVSGFFLVPTTSVSSTIFFKTNGDVSAISCTGSPIPPNMPIPTPIPAPKTVQTLWNTAVFPVKGQGACLGDTTAMTNSVIDTTLLRVGDSVRFVSSDGESHNLVQTGSSWRPITVMPDFRPVSPSTSFNHSLQFTKAGCFHFISNVTNAQSGRMRLRISITDTKGNSGCTAPCPGIIDPPFVVTPAVIVPPDDDLSFLERWWWAILICIIIVILIIGLIVYLVWYNNKTPTTTVTHRVVSQTPVVQPTAVDSAPVTTYYAPQGPPLTAYSATGSGLVQNPGGFMSSTYAQP